MQLRSPHGRTLVLDAGRSRLMGVLNITPDSFSDGGRYLQAETAIDHALRMVAAGAAVLDLGAESTRPGHTPVPPQTQIDRLLPVLAALRAKVDVPISIDTTQAKVADAALRAGADWINDTSALQHDPEMPAVVRQAGCPVVLMHRFEPARAAGAKADRSLVRQIAARLTERVAHAQVHGIARTQILLDPGIGFGTLPEDNVAILGFLGDLQALGQPLVIGPSRKSFLGHLTGRPVERRLFATAACVAILALAGVALVRVHDVQEMHDVVLVADAVRQMQKA